MASDGPPWVVGQNCNVTLRHPGVNGDVATGFYVKPETFRARLAPGPRVLELVVVSRDGLIHAGGVPSQLTAQQWHNLVLAFAGQVNSTLTLVDPGAVAWAVGVEEVEDRLSPLGGQLALGWETRLVLVEQ